MKEPLFNDPISEEAMEHIEAGQVYVTAAGSREYRERTAIVRVVDGPIPDEPDVVVETVESWNDEYVGHETSISPYSFVARLYHRE